MYFYALLELSAVSISIAALIGFFMIWNHVAKMRKSIDESNELNREAIKQLMIQNNLIARMVPKERPTAI